VWCVDIVVDLTLVDCLKFGFENPYFRHCSAPSRTGSSFFYRSCRNSLGLYKAPFWLILAPKVPCLSLLSRKNMNRNSYSQIMPRNVHYPNCIPDLDALFLFPDSSSYFGRNSFMRCPLDSIQIVLDCWFDPLQLYLSTCFQILRFGGPKWAWIQSERLETLGFCAIC
jgi:hypothetical protein